MGFAIIVTFKLKHGAQAAFLDLVRANAHQSVADEPGCLRFDVVEADSDRVCLYEIYTDSGAFDAHLQTPHFKAFDAETRDLVAAKIVVAGTAYERAKGGPDVP